MRSCEDCLFFQDCLLSTLGVCDDFVPRDSEDSEDEDEDVLVGVE